MKLISQEKKRKILEGIDKGKTAQKIAREVRVGVMTVTRIRNQERPDISKSIGGCPAKLSSTTKQYIRRMIQSGEISSASQAAKKLNSEEVNEKKKVCSETVRRALKSSGMKAVKKKKKTLLAARNHKKRLDFAMRHKDWTVEDWKRVIWSDETKINRMGSDGQKWAPGRR